MIVILWCDCDCVGIGCVVVILGVIVIVIVLVIVFAVSKQGRRWWEWRTQLKLVTRCEWGQGGLWCGVVWCNVV